MVGLGGMKSAAEPVMATGFDVHGAVPCFMSTRGIGPLRLSKLAVLFGFVMLFALFAQAVASVRRRRAVRRTALCHPVVDVRVVLPTLQAIDERLVRLLAVLPFGVRLLALDVSVVSHVIL